MDGITVDKTLNSTYTEGLNQEQVYAFTKITEFIGKKDTDNKMVSLVGYAGTGKTFLIDRIIMWAKDNLKSTRQLAALTAPTNMAVQQIRKAIPNSHNKVVFCTIYKLLGIREKINENGEMTFEPDKNLIYSITDFDILVLDEVSMLNDEIFELVKNNATKVKIIFMGDPAQIPPVGKRDSEPLLRPDYHNISVYRLTQIMRQKQDSGIVDFSMAVRNNIQAEFRYIERSYDSHDFCIYDPANLSEKETLLNQFKNLFEPNKDISRIKAIAWTNQKVKEYNNFIRTIHYGKESSKNRLIVGEIMTANEPLYVKKMLGRDRSVTEIGIVTNQEFTVVEFSETSYLYKAFHGKRRIEFAISCYRTKVCYFDYISEKERVDEVFIVKDDTERSDYFSALKTLRNMAVNCDIQDKKYYWKEFYDFKSKFANCNYAYAITCHKSQGSTYDTVFVDINNISLNPNVEERNRIIYTAVTRAKNKVIIIN